MRRQSGFTFFEILIGTIVLMIGIVSIIALVLWGRLVLKQSENKAAAMNVAFSKMEEYLAKSYSRIGTRQGASPDAIDSSIREVPLGQGKEGLLFFEEGPDRESNINWEVKVNQCYEGGPNYKFPSPNDVPAGHLTLPIPYKKIEVIARYQEESPSQKGTVYKKEVRLVSIVPYPVLHAISKEVGVIPGVTPPEVKASNNYNYQGSTVLEIDLGALKPEEKPSDPPVVVPYETPKEILIIYNIAIKIENFQGLIDDNPGLYTIFTACFVDDDANPIPVETRTPILSQPLISNVTALTGARALKVLRSGDKYKLRIKWRKDPDAKGKITLRSANIIVIAFEEQRS